MARIRSIKPEFPQSESMGRVSRDARLLFIELWTLCDDSGRTRANSRMLASLLFPYDSDAGTLMDGWLAELEREGCVIRYSAFDGTYLQVCNWLKHQKIDKPSASKIPEFAESSRILANPREVSSEDQGRDQGSRIKEGKGSKDQKRTAAPAESFTPPDWIDTDIWGTYLEMRKKKRATQTANALQMVIDELVKLQTAGDDPNEVLRKSIRSSWTDVYPLTKGTQGAQRKLSLSEQAAIAIREQQEIRAANARIIDYGN